MREVAFGDNTIGHYAWILANVQAIKPIPARGEQTYLELTGERT
jgi:hypothetical protein